MPPGSVLVVGNFASAWGAAAGACEALAVQLAAAGWQVTTTSRVRPRLRRLLNMLGSVWTQRRAYQVACVDVYSGLAFIWAGMVGLLLLLLRKPYVLVLHGGGLPGFANRLGWPLEFLAKRSAGIVAQTGYLATCVPKHQAMVTLIPNALDIRCYSYRLRERPAAELVWLRSFHQIYNPGLAVEALALLVEEFPSVTLTMIGPDHGDGSLSASRALADALGIADRVHFVGSVTKAAVPSWLEKADIFLNTTDFDNTPVSVEEAMACGLCVVSTNVGGLPYLLDDGDTALLVPPRDANALARAIRLILTDSDVAARLSARGRQKAESLDWADVLPLWESLLCSVSPSSVTPGVG